MWVWIHFLNAKTKVQLISGFVKFQKVNWDKNVLKTEFSVKFKNASHSFRGGTFSLKVCFEQEVHQLSEMGKYWSETGMKWD